MPTVLLVDDERNVHQTFEDAMESGIRVIHAFDGREALALLESEEVELIVTDLTMPQLDGIGLLREVRARGIKAPALVLSAHGTVPNVVEAIQLGALDFIEKPGGTDRLRMAVALALRSGLTMRLTSAVAPGRRSMASVIYPGRAGTASP